MIDGGKKNFFPSSHRMVICIPSGITEVEMRAVKESAERVNGKEVYLIHEPMAAAIGIGLDIMQPKGNMIVDIGGGTTEIAVIALGGIVCDKSGMSLPMTSFTICVPSITFMLEKVLPRISKSRLVRLPKTCSLHQMKCLFREGIC